MKRPQIVIEKHPDCYVARLTGVNGIVIGEGETWASALAEVISAIEFHLKSFGPEAFIN